MPAIVVSGALANKLHNGGEAWVRLSWLLGLRRLGCDVFFVEQIEPRLCHDEHGKVVPLEGSENWRYFQSVLSGFGLVGHAALMTSDGEQYCGSNSSGLLSLCKAADLLVNISGHLTYAPLLTAFRRRAYIDIDPGFTQFWHASGNNGAHLDNHEWHFTIGANLGRPDCDIPLCGRLWHILPPPVVLNEWPAMASEAPFRFTTVANWRGPYGPIEHGGQKLGLKVHEFRKFIELPRLVSTPLEIALNIHPADASDLKMLEANGWQIVDPRTVASNPFSFRRYIQNSGGEFSLAQGVYVRTRSGWFSDRSVRYLASGKPVVVQDTGLANHLPIGRGLLTFETVETAAAALEAAVRDLPEHREHARRIAERFFDSDKVLTRLLEVAGLEK